jgi:serine/threonine protein kinase
MNELAGQNLGGYVLEEEIGHGSMGMVYRGKQIALGREVAIKVLPRSLAQDPSYVARFIREAQIIAGLNHPNIIQIYDAGQQIGLLYFVMEYVQGPTLSSLLRLDGSLPEHLAAEYVAQIADALDAAYKERNVIHRDIKPENLMLDRWGKIKVMDFGLARAPGLQQITVAKTLVGSIYYASPEQIWGMPLDNRSDIYALGVVLYEMVTGHRPFAGRTLQDLTQAITTGRVLPPSALNLELTPTLERVILTAMASNRNDRYAVASLLAQELRDLRLHAPSAKKLSQPQERGPLSRGEKDSTYTLLPKRPQFQHPLSSTLATPLDELPHTPPVSSNESRPQHSPNPQLYAAGSDYVAQTPLANQVREVTRQKQSPDSSAAIEPAQSTEAAEHRHLRWRPLPRIFKPSS